MLIIIPPWESHPADASPRATAVSMYADHHEHHHVSHGGDAHSYIYIYIIMISYSLESGGFAQLFVHVA